MNCMIKVWPLAWACSVKVAKTAVLWFQTPFYQTVLREHCKAKTILFSHQNPPMPNLLTTYVHHHSRRVAGTLRDGVIWFESFPELHWRFGTRSDTSTSYHPKFQWATLPKFPSLSSPSPILKGSWFWEDATMMPCTMGVHRQFLADKWSVQTIGDGKNEQRQGSFGRVFNTWQRVFTWYLLYIHHHLEVHFWFRGQNAWLPFAWLCESNAGTQDTENGSIKRLLVCSTTHHERSGCILVQMLSFPSPSIYTTWDEPWHIRMHHFFAAPWAHHSASRHSKTHHSES